MNMTMVKSGQTKSKILRDASSSSSSSLASFNWNTPTLNEDEEFFNSLVSRSYIYEINHSELCDNLADYILMDTWRMSGRRLSRFYFELLKPCPDGHSPFIRLVEERKLKTLQLAWVLSNPLTSDAVRSRVDDLMYDTAHDTQKSHGASSSNDVEIEITPFEKRLVNIQDENGNTLLHWAAANNDLLVAVLAIMKGADVTLMNNLKQNALHLAVRSRSLHVFAYLLPYYSTESLGEVDYKGRTVLHFAALAGRSYALNALLENMLIDDILGQDERGNTALHHAVRHPKIELNTIELIADYMQSRNDLGIQNNQGKTVLHMAIESGRTEIAKVLATKMQLDQLNLVDEHGRKAYKLADKGTKLAIKFILSRKLRKSRSSKSLNE